MNQLYFIHKIKESANCVSINRKTKKNIINKKNTITASSGK